MPDYFYNSFETKFFFFFLYYPVLFFHLGALGNCLTRLREGPALNMNYSFFLSEKHGVFRLLFNQYTVNLSVLSHGTS